MSSPTKNKNVKKDVEMRIEDFEKVFKDYKAKPLGHHRESAVLVPLVERNGELHILYEVRAETLRTQPGQVSFPGGRIDEGETPEECAIREACEELCLEPEDIRIISPLDYLHNYNNITIYPFLGVIDFYTCAKVTASRDEVKEIFFVPLKFFLEKEPLIIESQIKPVVPDDFPYELINKPQGYGWLRGRSPIPIYQYEDYSIWGMTALITHDLITKMKEANV